MNEQVIDHIEMVVNLGLENEKICTLLYETLVLESGYNPNDRAQVSMEKESNKLILKILAKDSISARAAINSFMKWINVSLQIISISNKK
ncbi:MAG: KEOPS complex subunit Pcc1 [Candidatus Heimdallarchaeota archaeon]